MKNNIILMSLISSLIFTGAANASLGDEAHGNFTGQLDFNGTITNTNPIWLWQIPEQVKNKVKDIDRTYQDIIVENNNGKVKLISSDLPILEGYMSQLVAQGGVGLTPEIRIADQVAQEALRPEGVPVSIEAKAGDVVVGQVDLNYILDAAAEFQNGGEWMGTPVTQDMHRLQLNALMLKVKGAHTITTNIRNTMDGYDQTLHNSNYHDLAETRLITLSSATLSFPESKIPETWTATLPLTVVLK